MGRLRRNVTAKYSPGEMAQLLADRSRLAGTFPSVKSLPAFIVARAPGNTLAIRFCSWYQDVALSCVWTRRLDRLVQLGDSAFYSLGPGFLMRRNIVVRADRSVGI